MSDPTHELILLQGVDSWNSWREEDTEIRPDLGGAKLEGDPRRKGSVEEPYEYWLDAIDLHAALLARASVEDASLRAALLDGAELKGARISRSSLRGASLKGACLVGAELRDVDLDNADISAATFGDTLLARVDLSNVKGLEAATHRYSSMVDVATLERTKAGLARRTNTGLQRLLAVQTFLSGCGVPSAYLSLLESA
jgi:uncharacterized protein YjbI with pentapeptide repeats